MVGLGEPRVVRAGVVGGSYFEVMGLRPVLGRLLDATRRRAEGRGRGGADLPLLDDGAGQRSVRDRQDRSGSATRSATIVGVLEPSVPYPAETEIIANVVTSPHHLSATMVDGPRAPDDGAVRPARARAPTLDAARAELRAVHGAMVKEHPEAYPPKADFRIDAVRLRDQITSPARTVLLVLLAASALVFVIACSNVANLILARSVRREGELAIRAALGAEHRRAAADAARREPAAVRRRRGARRADRAADGRGAGALRGALLGARARSHRRRQPAVGRRRPGARRGGAAGVRAAAAVRRRVERLRPVERQRAHHVGHEPPAARCSR